MNRTMFKMVGATLAVMVTLGLAVTACGGDSNGKSSGTTTTAAASGGGGGGSAAGDAAVGKDLYGKTCASCHGPDAKGLPKLGKDLTNSEFAMGLSDADLVAFIKKGRPASDPANTTKVDMPPKGGNPSLSDKDLQDIVAYIRTLEK